MAKLNQAQEQTMEEILASIRRMISDDEARAAQPKAPESRIDPAGPRANVSRLFAKPETKPSPGGAPNGEPEQAAPPRDASNVIEIALDHAMEETADEAEVKPSDDGDEGPAVPVLTAGALPTSSQPEQTRTQQPSNERRVAPLLSPHSDAAVASAFDQLASTMLSGSVRTIDELVEDLLRPMLRNWLDANLPPLVERLVREEIERVSRGRR